MTEAIPSKKPIGSPPGWCFPSTRRKSSCLQRPAAPSWRASQVLQLSRPLARSRISMGGAPPCDKLGHCKIQIRTMASELGRHPLPHQAGLMLSMIWSATQPANSKSARKKKRQPKTPNALEAGIAIGAFFLLPLSAATGQRAVTTECRWAEKGIRAAAVTSAPKGQV
jgi:hypothetical protein